MPTSRSSGAELSAARRAARATFAGLVALAGLVIALPVALGLAALSGVAAASRALGRALSREGMSWPGAFDFDPGIGWTLKPNLDCRIGPEAFYITTDAEGWRGRSTSIDEADMIVIGDSFAFGHCVDEPDFFASRSRGPRVKGVGAPGYDMVSGFLCMQRLQGRLAGKTVVWMIYLGNDLDQNLQPAMRGYRSPFVRESADGSGRWEVVTSHLSREPWPFEIRGPGFKNVVEICCSTDFTERVFSACEWLIGEAHALCDAADARLIVMSVPDLSPLVQRQFARALAERPDADRYDPTLPDRRLEEICGRSGIRFVALADHLEEADYLPHDVHWTESGHAKVAALLDEIHAGPMPGGLSVSRRTPRDREPSPPAGRPAVAR